MKFLLIIVVLYITAEVVLQILKEKLLLLLKNSPHENLLEQMNLAKLFWSPFRKKEWTPIKYVFKRTHRTLNNKPLSNLCDLMILVYLMIWVLMLALTLKFSIYMM